MTFPIYGRAKLAPHRRSDHLPGGYCSDAMETAGRLQHIHPRLARRLRRFSRTSRWHHDLRLLSRSKVRFTVDDLYLRGGIYEYSKGLNWRAVAALALGAWDRAGGSRSTARTRFV